MNATTPFSRTTVIALIVAGFLIFFAATLLAVFGNQVEVRRPAGANAYSNAAIGYRAYTELLDALAIPVLISRNQSVERAGEQGLLVAAEPPLSAKPQFLQMTGSRNVLLILPKWRGVPDPTQPKWLAQAFLRDLEDVTKIAKFLPLEGTAVRPETVSAWRRPEHFPAPHIDGAVQLFQDTPQFLTPIIGTDEGVLLGKVRFSQSNIYILSDPDILSNHGLGKGDNAVLVARIFDELRNGGVVVIDEEIHGFKRSPSLWQTLFELPFAAVTIVSVAACLMILWMSIGRFGAPLRARATQAIGKDTLINNTVELLLFGGHMAPILERYFTAVRQRVVHRLHAPHGLNDTELTTWLEQTGRAKGVTHSFTKLKNDIEKITHGNASGTARIVLMGVRLWTWEREITDDIGSH